jgi:hypothetical protein
MQTTTVMRFPWFTYTGDTDERAAYQLFIDRLCERAKRSKVMHESDTAANDEKYIMSRFLYRLGINGAGYRNARQILMRNLDGTAWKNLSYKRKQAAKAATAAETAKAE